LLIIVGHIVIAKTQAIGQFKAVAAQDKSLLNQCYGSKTFHYGSGSDFSMSSGSGSTFQKFPDLVSDPTFFLKKYDFKGPKMAFQNIIFKEYLHIKMVKITKLLLF
jgi:hypothetical protein